MLGLPNELLHMHAHFVVLLFLHARDAFLDLWGGGEGAKWMGFFLFFFWGGVGGGEVYAGEAIS